MIVFENRVMRKISGPKRDKTTGERKRLHIEEFYGQYYTENYLDNQIKKNEIGWACGTYGTQQRCIHGFGGDT
jgi:hypothetical protein